MQPHPLRITRMLRRVFKVPPLSGNENRVSSVNSIKLMTKVAALIPSPIAHVVRLDPHSLSLPANLTLMRQRSSHNDAATVFSH
ncbi:hypothetical protein RRG08_009479 [Elysia crispata]|uniref:Uncharacterized protein n=1 Tax=Elysia crispata TaxID=231223 RepID=A0AAE1ASX9_9GAST|nr:hypothetical protein RRG08_009479 [Elysia crispata]